MSQDRHSIAQLPELITDADEKARREAQNGIRQYNLAIDIIKTHVHDRERPFRLRPSLILQLHKEALDGIHIFAGTFRNTAVKIGGSSHVPVDAFMVVDEVNELCDYVNEKWDICNAIHLSSYVLWKLNWVHPFPDGNGRTARAVSYVVLNIKLNALLPGSPSIMDQIAADKQPYYDALEAADEAFREYNAVDLARLESMLDSMLAVQLLGAAREAVS